MARIYRTCVSFSRTRVSRHALRPPEAWGRRRGAHGNVARCIIQCSLSVLIRSAKSTILDSAQEVWRMQGGLVICKAARTHILTSRYRGTSTRLRKPRLMAQQHHHAGHARIQDPMVHKRSCLHRLGSNAGRVEPGVLDPCPDLSMHYPRCCSTTDKIFLVLSLRSPLTRDCDGTELGIARVASLRPTVFMGHGTTLHVDRV